MLYIVYIFSKYCTCQNIYSISFYNYPVVKTKSDNNNNNNNNNDLVIMIIINTCF